MFNKTVLVLLIELLFDPIHVRSFDQIKPVPTAKEQQARRVAAEGRKARLQRDTEIRRRVLDAA
ncbi:MAG: hypothetical protein R3E42_02180 [Burkholderiaceae bacterium]